MFMHNNQEYVYHVDHFDTLYNCCFRNLLRKDYSEEKWASAISMIYRTMHCKNNESQSWNLTFIPICIES